MAEKAMRTGPWIKCAKGVRYREHPTRRHGVKRDRYFSIYYSLNGVQKEEGLGWASKGWTQDKAVKQLADLKEAQRTGRGPQTLEESREAKAIERAKKKQDGLTFAAAWEIYAPLLEKKKSAFRERQLYKTWIKPVIGASRLADIAPLTLERIRKNMTDKGLSLRTVDYAYAVVRQVFNVMRKQRLFIGENPVEHVDKPKYDNRRFRFLTHAEAEKLLTALAERSKDVHDMALLSLMAGMRWGEINSLTWGDVLLEHELILLRDTKNTRTRPVHLNERALAMLRSRGPGKVQEQVFPPRQGETRNLLSRTFIRTVQKLGYNKAITDRRQRVTFHSLRHTFASWLVQDGVDLYSVKELLGHKTLQMTERYSHLNADRLKSAVQGIGNHKAEVVDLAAEGGAK